MSSKFERHETGLEKVVVGNTLYVFFRGELIYKRWLDHNYSQVFNKKGGY